MSQDLDNARLKYYIEKQETCIKDLAKAHLKVYEQHMGRRFEDQQELELFERVYTIRDWSKGKQKESWNGSHFLFL